MPRIHPTAIVTGDCSLEADVEIGPGCVLTGPVRLDRGVRLIGHVYLTGPVRIGDGTVVYPFTCIGFPPQDTKFAEGSPTAGVEIGARCVLREQVTVHASWSPEIPTRVGHRVFMMAQSHVGHDAQVGNDVVMVNVSGVAGHARVGDGATLGGSALVHQHTRIGRLAFLSGGTAVSADVPPFCTLVERNRLGGINLVGMRRAGIPRDEITRARAAFRDVFRPALPRGEMLAILEARSAESAVVAEMARFVREAQRPICAGAGRPPRLLAAWLHAWRRGQGFELATHDHEPEL